MCLFAEAMGWPELIDRFGVSITVLIILCIAIALVTRTLWGWFRPWADKILEAHLGLVNNMDEAIVTLVELGKKTDQRLDRMERGIKCMSPVATTDDLADIESKLAQLKRAVGK